MLTLKDTYQTIKIDLHIPSPLALAYSQKVTRKKTEVPVSVSSYFYCF